MGARVARLRIGEGVIVTAFEFVLGVMVTGALAILWRQHRNGDLLSGHERALYEERRRRAEEAVTVRRFPCWERPCWARLTALEVVRWGGRCGYHNIVRQLEEQRRRVERD